ncbi:hypothetical protein TDB9533_01858 [Thalassocella blandensis]|nr:hypothetical protein TDB9533_01858 [Thalassocella blandensis]
MSDSAVTIDDGNIFRSGLVKTAFVTFLILYFLYLILSKAPASIAAWAVHKAVPTVWLTSVEGSLWDGVARGAQIDLGSQTVPLGQVSWKLNPLSILFFSPCVTFKSDMSSGKVCHNLAGGSSVENLMLDAPLAVIKDLLPFEAAGQLSLQVIDASFSNQNVKHLDAKLSVQGTRINPLGDWVNLGSIAARAESNGQGGVKASIFDIQSPIGIDMLADWTPGAENWKLSGTVKLKTESPEIFRQGLPTLGEEVDKDTYKLQWP